MTERRYTEARFMRPDGSQFHGKVVDVNFKDTPLGVTSYDRFRTHIKSTGGPFKGTDVFELPCDINIYVFSDNDYFNFCIQTDGIFEVLNTDENGMSLKTISMSKVFPAFVKNPFMRADKETILEIIEAFAKAAVEAEE